MFSHADLVELDHQLREQNVLSIYVNGDFSDIAERSQWRTALRNALDEVERSLAGATHAEREGFSSARALAMDEIDRYKAGDASPGWMGIVTSDAVHYAGVLSMSVPTHATWTLGANLAPAVRALKEATPVFVAVADSTTVRIHRYVDRAIELIEAIDSIVKVDQPYHMSRPAPQGFSSGTRGRPGAEAAQRERQKATDTMLAEAASRIEQLAGNDAWILLGGIDVVATQLFARLDKRLGERASVVSIDVHDNSARLAGIAREHASRLRSVADLQKIDDVVAAHAAGGTGAVGLHQIDKALELGQVHELFVTTAFVEKHAEEAEVAIRRAFEKGASVEHVSGEAADRLDMEGGVAAKLRFTISEKANSTTTPP